LGKEVFAKEKAKDEKKEREQELALHGVLLFC
jgi:hypothetical protein